MVIHDKSCTNMSNSTSRLLHVIEATHAIGNKIYLIKFYDFRVHISFVIGAADCITYFKLT